MSKKTKKKQNKKILIISNIILGIYLLISLFLLGIIIKLSVLPLKYILIILPIYIIFTLLFGFLTIKKNIKSGIKIFIDVILSILIIIYSSGLIYLNKALNFMDKIKAKDYQTEEYYVIVLKDSGYDNVNQIKEIGIYESNDNYKNALEELHKKIDFTEKKYNNYTNAVNNLLNKKVEAVFISSSHKSILEEQLDFDKIKIIDTTEIKIKNDVKIEDIDVTKESFNIYISGIDIYGNISQVSRSDVNMIATINPRTHEILLTSIPRDYYVRLHGTTGYKDKLTHAGLYGINMSIETLEDLFEINIDYYVRVNFTTLLNLVDAIGGVDITSDKAFTARTNGSCTYVKGKNHLDGKCALAFSRERYAYSEGDRHRVQNQQAVITAILNKALSSSTLVKKYSSILESMGSSFQTNMPQDKIYSLVNMQLDSMPKWNITSISVNGKDSSNYTYSYSAGKLYVMEPDMSTVVNATNKIKELENK
mgnify:FL=1